MCNNIVVVSKSVEQAIQTMRATWPSVCNHLHTVFSTTLTRSCSASAVALATCATRMALLLASCWCSHSILSVCVSQ